jgi:hypothetical protein
MSARKAATSSPVSSSAVVGVPSWAFVAGPGDVVIGPDVGGPDVDTHPTSESSVARKAIP